MREQNWTAAGANHICKKHKTEIDRFPKKIIKIYATIPLHYIVIGNLQMLKCNTQINCKILKQGSLDIKRKATQVYTKDL